MNRLIRIMQNYLTIGFIFIPILFLYNFYLVSTSQAGLRNIIQEILSFNFMFWCPCLFVFLAMLVIIPTAREITLTRLANLKERDECEQYLTGQAARATYISTLSLTIFLLFLSVFSISVYHFDKPLMNAATGQNHQWEVVFQVGFKLTDVPSNVISGSKLKARVFSSEDITPSKPLMLSILIFWQLLIFNMTARKMRRELE